jgi:hypothetical protein
LETVHMKVDWWEMALAKQVGRLERERERE